MQILQMSSKVQKNMWFFVLRRPNMSPLLIKVIYCDMVKTSRNLCMMSGPQFGYRTRIQSPELRELPITQNHESPGHFLLAG